MKLIKKPYLGFGIIFENPTFKKLNKTLFFYTKVLHWILIRLTMHFLERISQRLSAFCEKTEWVLAANGLPHTPLPATITCRISPKQCPHRRMIFAFDRTFCKVSSWIFSYFMFWPIWIYLIFKTWKIRGKKLLKRYDDDHYW